MRLDNITTQHEQVDENWATKAMAGKPQLKKKYRAPKDDDSQDKRLKKAMYGNMMGKLKEGGNEETGQDLLRGLNDQTGLQFELIDQDGSPEQTTYVFAHYPEEVTVYVTVDTVDQGNRRKPHYQIDLETPDGRHETVSEYRVDLANASQLFQSEDAYMIASAVEEYVEESVDESEAIDRYKHRQGVARKWAHRKQDPAAHYRGWNSTDVDREHAKNKAKKRGIDADDYDVKPNKNKKVFGRGHLPEDSEGGLPDQGPIAFDQLPEMISDFLSSLFGAYWNRESEASANVIPYSDGYGYTYKNSAGPGNTGMSLLRLGVVKSEDELYTPKGSPKDNFRFKLGNYDVSIRWQGQAAILRFSGPMKEAKKTNEGAEDFVRDMTRVHGWSMAKAEAEARKRFPDEYGIDPNENRHVEVRIGGKPWKVVAHKNIAFKIKATLEAKGKEVELYYTDKPVSESVNEKEEAPAKPDAEKAKRRKEIEAHQTRRREMGDDYWTDEAGSNGGPKKRRMGGRYGYGASDDEINESHRIKEMKDELNKQLTEGVLDATDDDGWMAKSQLYKAAKYAIALHGMINDADELPAWVQSKITSVSEDLSDVKHFLEYAEMSIPEVEPETDYQISPESIESAGIDFYESIKQKIK